jgi:hypothetical protein
MWSQQDTLKDVWRPSGSWETPELLLYLIYKQTKTWQILLQKGYHGMWLKLHLGRWVWDPCEFTVVVTQPFWSEIPWLRTWGKKLLVNWGEYIDNPLMWRCNTLREMRHCEVGWRECLNMFYWLQQVKMLSYRAFLKEHTYMSLTIKRRSLWDLGDL